MTNGQKKEKPFDPSKPLKNIKHEIFTNMLVKNNGNQSKSYIDTYGQQTKTHSRINASKLMTNHNIQERVNYLLQKNKALNLEATLENLAQLTQAKKTIIHDEEAVLTEVPDNTARTAANTTVLKLHGVLKTDQNTYIDARTQSVIAGSPEDIAKVLEKLTSLTERWEKRDRPSGVIDVSP
jgi:hypothetical protein